MNALVAHIASLLEDLYDRDEAESLAWWVAEETTGLSRTQLLCDCKGTTFSPYMQEVVSRLRHFEPIQYVFGHTLWCGLDLKVTPATLIPRPETAELVIKVESLKLKDERPRILDVCTGSGCIAIALKKRHPEWQVTGIDISAEAIEIAKENAQRNNVEVRFEVADIFDFNGENYKGPMANGKYDIIVFNPPYIRESEKMEMRRNVLDFEPAQALFVPDDDPLKFYRQIASLRLGQQLFFEINEAFGNEVEQLMCEYGYVDVQIIKDSYGKARIVEGRMA